MQKILVVSARPDDEVLGCGATLHWYTTAGDQVHVMLLADGEGGRLEQPDLLRNQERMGGMLQLISSEWKGSIPSLFLRTASTVYRYLN